MLQVELWILPNELSPSYAKPHLLSVTVYCYLPLLWTIWYHLSSDILNLRQPLFQNPLLSNSYNLYPLKLRVNPSVLNIWISRAPLYIISRKITRYTTKVGGCNFVTLAFWHAGACLTLLYTTVEENLRGMNERKNERKNERNNERKNDRKTHTRAF